PRLSTTIWRLRPSTFLALSLPVASPPELVSTDWLSILAVRPGFSCLRTRSRKVSWIVSRVPLCRPARETGTFQELGPSIRGPFLIGWKINEERPRARFRRVHASGRGTCCRPPASLSAGKVTRRWLLIL